MAKKRNDLKGGFSSIIDNIKSSIMNVSSANTTDDIDAALARITSSVVDKDASNYAEMIKTTFSDILQQKFNFKDVSREFIQTYSNSDRFLRYSNAEEIVDSIPYCARALKVLADETVAPDDINKTIIKIVNKWKTDKC